MKNLHHIPLIAFLLLFCAACGDDSRQEVHFLRFEHFLFDDTGSNQQQANDFQSPLLNYHPEDPAFAQSLADFTADPVILDIYRITDSLYHDLGWLEKELGKALSKAEKLYPTMHYDHFYTLLTADFDNYPTRVFCNQHEVAVSLDRYAVGYMQQYHYFGLPAYLVAISSAQHIVPDCMAAIAREYIVLPDGEMTLLDYAIAEGKVLYFLEQTLPNTADTLCLRYSADQLEWMEENTANVWSWLIQNRLLYTTDLTALRNLVDDAPKTNAFGDGSAPRTASYLGWQIVRAYVKRSGCSMQQLFDETDSQKVLTQSAWRP